MTGRLGAASRPPSRTPLRQPALRSNQVTVGGEPRARREGSSGLNDGRLVSTQDVIVDLALTGRRALTRTRTRSLARKTRPAMEVGLRIGPLPRARRTR